MLRISFEVLGRGLVKFYLLICLSVFGHSLPVAFAETGVFALDSSAIAVKTPSATAFVAISRVGHRLIAAGLHGVIVVSSDNGATWQQAAVPVDVTLTALYFQSKQEGWAVGHFGVILHTLDGGATWSRVVDGLNVINALNATAALAQAQAPNNPDTALKQRVATAFQNAGPSKPFLTIGACGNGILAAGQQDIAMFSADGGKSWQEWTSSIDNPTFRNIYAITSENKLPILIGEDGLMLRGDANCKNFKPMPSSFGATFFGAVKDPNDLLLYGIDGVAVLSADGGTTWNRTPLNTDAVIDSGLLLNSGEMLLGSLDGKLYISDVGLKSFHQAAVSVPFQIAQMAVAPDGDLVVAGNGGLVIVPSESIR